MAMNPVQFTNDPAQFRRLRDRLNVILVFSGMAVGENGQMGWVKPASNLDEAMARADRLRYLLESRAVHSDVLNYCRAELLDKNYFHAIFEATKSVAAKIRSLTGHPGDGAPLVQAALGGQNPPLAINDLNNSLT